ncbi:MAG: AAA family ATPase [Lachnospiraceae bacterium]|nr:AAA family ATPase [Lachnospiraceae bacterium]
MSIEYNVPKVTVGRFVQEMSQMYLALFAKEWPLSKLPAPFVWGPAGVGKSESVYQIADRISEQTGKHVKVTDIRLSMFSPIDLRGIPVADKEKEFTVWLKPKIFELEESEDTINILFFDELSSAPQQVQAAAYQITLNHCIGEHKLPENCIIIGAGNRTIDKSVVFKMPNALANRLQHYEITVDFEVWKEWAINNRIHPYIVGYLSFDNTKLCQEEIPAEQIAFPSPRTWTFLSNILWVMDGVKKVEDMYTQIAACVGVDTAIAFIEWVKKQKELPNVADIFKGKFSKYPASSDALYALIISMVSYVEKKEKKSGNGVLKPELENMAVYASKFSSDYQAALYTNLEQIKSVKDKLSTVKLYKDYKRRTAL